MKKRILSLLLVFVMVLGLLPTAAFAEEKTYEVTIHVAPSTANAVFYAGGDTTTALTTEVADKGIVENYHQYVLTVPEGTYTYRGTDGDTNLGGMTFEVPFDELMCVIPLIENAMEEAVSLRVKLKADYEYGDSLYEC